MSRPTVAFTLIAGFVGGVFGAALVWSLQHGLISGAAAQGYLVALQTDEPRMTPGILVFLVFALYWSFAAGARAGDQSAEPRWSTTLHRALVTVSVAAILLPVPGLSARFVPASGWVVAAGLAIELAGVVLAVIARRTLGRNWSSEVRIAEGHALVRTGLYRRIRHPIYLGVLLLYLGLALQSGRLNALAGLALAVAAYWRKIALEEQVLARRFGAAFEAWRKESWALVPPLL